MTPLRHVLHTVTLATWLCVGALGVLGIFLPLHLADPTVLEESEPPTEFKAPEISLGAPSPELNAEPTAPESAATSPEQAPSPEELPSPPDMSADLPEIPEIPEVPDLPPSPAISHSPEIASEVTSPTHPSPTHHSPTSKPSKSKHSQTTNHGQASAGSGNNTATTNASRLAAGKMPAPSYPAAARRAGQSGTVVVKFTVDATGSVISAAAVNPSQWPLLNEEAVKTVKKWKFPPGGIMTLQRPIVFQLR